MADQPQQHDLRAAVETVLNEQASAERYRRSQWESKRRRRQAAEDLARPLEFDESGFPIRQRNPRFGKGVARLLRGD